MHAHTHVHTTHTHTKFRKYACHGHAGKGGSKNNFLSTGIRKTTVERGSAWERVRDKGIRSVRTHQSAEGKICKGDATIWVLSLSSWTQDREDRLVESQLEPGKPSVKTQDVYRNTGRLVSFSMYEIQVYITVYRLHRGVNTSLKPSFLSKWAATMNWRCLKLGNEFLCPKAQALLKRNREDRNTEES